VGLQTKPNFKKPPNPYFLNTLLANGFLGKHCGFSQKGSLTYSTLRKIII